MMKQLGFGDGFANPRLGSNKKLEEIDRLIDWSVLAALAKRVRPGRTGRPPYEALSMLKALYLQRLYDLSDPQLEEALLDRFSFRKFCGLTMHDDTPDETTILRFRHDAAEVGVLEECFAAVNSQLEARDLVLRQGTMMDASIIRAQRRPPPLAAGRGAVNPQEPNAGWTGRGGKTVLGYKAHIGVDQGSGLVRRVVVTSARVYESEVADDLICGDERAVYGDRAYPLKARRARLRRLGIKDRIMHRANKHHPRITGWRARWNKLVARRRAPVEAVFSAMKHVAADVWTFVTIYNLRRAAILKAA
jgi:IS5 family transposase